MYGIIYTVHVPLCSIHFLISLIDKRSSFPMLYNPTFLYTFVFSISWLLKPAMYAYKYRLAFLSETNRWLSINYQTKKVCLTRHTLFNTSAAILFRASGFSSGHVLIYSGVQKPDPDGEKLHSSVLPHRLPRDITAVYSDFRFLSSVPR